ncbi:hypothetical protein C8F04DRAFT_1003958 [Mycena alexandri]|uniref:Uncharacterized protein n=1 Tax=Mycena alexandri TaxID=1745969 RepID=A0AAD6S6T6_9AGAR|nr:hypothetical protein C8F04DRAFT_1140192 [Mycena alexandri]KAJ7032448.1 hypothetical protein C8F04DRAFT_1003958 [Mycena alexandri]
MPQNVVVIGAGIGGVSLGIALKRQLGRDFDDFVIYEKASDVGGTWRDNIYPGASSDIFMHFYSLSTDLNPDWNATHGTQPEMHAYWRKLTTKYELYPRIVFNRLVVSAKWSPSEQLYHVITEDVQSHEQFSTTAKILISALGVLDVPRFPNIPGLSSFEGNLFHSARWDTGVELRGKRVAVIGNGASATQLVPLISEDPDVKITQFCRTPNWMSPPIGFNYTPRRKWVFRNVPLVMRAYRLFLYLRGELLYLSVFANPATRAKISARVTNYIKHMAPKEDVERLIPDYPMGCKRLLRNTNYLQSLHKPNLRLNWDGIQSVEEDGLITKKGDKLPFDVMIFATGFTADRYPLTVVGDAGKSVQEYYDSQSGPKAYLGTTVPGFPNFFMLAGPNTSTGHTSAILAEEMQIAYILKFVKPILAGQVASFTVTPRATDEYNDLIHARLSRSVFVQCASWYRAGSEGKVYSIFPGPMMLFGWWLYAPRWADYDVKRTVRTGKWERSVRVEMWTRWLKPGYYLGLAFGLFVTWISS